MKRIVALALCLLPVLLAPKAVLSQEWSASVSPELARADLSALYAGLRAGHYNLYANQSKSDYDALYEEQLGLLDQPLTRFELWRTLQLFTAYGKVAHARIEFPGEVYGDYREAGGKAFPIYLRIVDGRSYVGEDYSGVDAVSPGDEILAIDGIPMAEWLERAGRYLSADTPYISHSLLETRFPMYLWLEAGEQDQYRLDLRKNNNRTMQARVDALSYDELVAQIESTPTTFALDYNARDAQILEGGVAYFRPGPFYNVEDPERLWDNSGFMGFVEQSFNKFQQARAETLIIDLRNNPGGDNSFSDPIIAWIADQPFRFSSRFVVRSSAEAAASNQARLEASESPAGSVSARYAEAFASTPHGESFEFDIDYAQPRAGGRFEGDVYVLINRNSYSNAVNSAAIIKDYGWGVIVGEPTADFATTYGAMEHFNLPHSGFRVGFPKALIIRPSGDETPGGVVPDISIETPIATASSDVVLDSLLEIIRSK